MEEYLSYSKKLERLAISLIADPTAAPHYSEEIKTALNGGPRDALRKIVPIQKLKRTGSFFSSDKLVNFLSTRSKLVSSNDGRTFDPACGVGDLLLLAARSLPVQESLRETFGLWGERLFGHDLHQEFIRATKARLVLSAFETKNNFVADPLLHLDDLFPNIGTADGLASHYNYSLASEILINPPFTKMMAPSGCTWAHGKVSSAAVFLETCVLKASPGTRIVAILPDVLRSGTFYTHWRRHIGSFANVDNVAIFGQFDKYTDVSVFVVYLTVLDSVRHNGYSNDWWFDGCSSRTVSNFFDVSVGAVVPFRDPERGPEYSYIQPKGLPKWTEVKAFTQRRRFSGTTTQAPFVVVRRNSRFEDLSRATATIIGGKEQIAVENHLIVLKPKDGKLASCKDLLSLLRRPETNVWLNNRIRCRHLTVSAVRNLPWID